MKYEHARNGSHATALGVPVLVHFTFYSSTKRYTVLPVLLAEIDHT